MSELRVFISHAHEDKALAKAWQTLIRTLTLGQVDPWYSSDERAGKGIVSGEWREKIRQKMAESDIILVLLTPGSNERPWVVWESGYAEGQQKEIVPVTFFMDERGMHEVFRDKQFYEGDKPNADEKQGVLKLVQNLADIHFGPNIPDSSKLVWSTYIAEYMTAIEQERTDSLTRSLFHDHFHVRDTAEKLSGDWYAVWTEKSNGEETVFEMDRLKAWTTENRIRLVGTSSKVGVKELLTDAAEEVYYPMEGVVSSDGYIALSYWSALEITICGTALLKITSVSGRVLEGTWQGYTARHIDLVPKLTHGRVILARDEKKLQSMRKKMLEV